MPNAMDLGSEQVPLEDVLPLGVIRRAARLTHWAAEDARSARAFLKRVAAIEPLAMSLQAIQIIELPRPRKGSHEAVSAQTWNALLQPALAGHDLGLISEAGLPAVADPGTALVAAAHAQGVPVLPLAGASSLLLALAASGLNGQNFAFVGYLPQDAGARTTRLRELEALSRRTGQTQLLIETPYRNAALLAALLDGLAPSTRLSVSCGLTLPGGWTRTETVSRWRERPPQMPDRLPAVFGLLAV
ncbi:MAG: SAM-dependent methyltransferase [Rubrivivax sp.]|nr:SAM-dependent methyltransferase [Rubrivivax sp.]